MHYARLFTTNTKYRSHRLIAWHFWKDTSICGVERIGRDSRERVSVSQNWKSLLTLLSPIACRYTDIINRLYSVMLTALIDQIEQLDNISSAQSYFVRLVYVTNEIIQFSERKLIDKNRCEWSFNTIASANCTLRQYVAVHHILSSNRVQKTCHLRFCFSKPT